MHVLKLKIDSLAQEHIAQSHELTSNVHSYLYTLSAHCGKIS